MYFKFSIRNLFSQNYWTLRSYRLTVAAIESQNKKWSNWTETDIKTKAQALKIQGQAKKTNQTQLLIEAFALAMLVIERVIKIRLHTVQLYGALALHYGNVAEMKTGEGKTLTAVLPAFLNSILTNKVYIVTVNEYLVERDGKNNAPIFKLLGLTVGYVLATMDPNIKRDVYSSDIIYLTNSELGFDYLRDNMRGFNEEAMLQRLDYIIVDEVDSILIDEGRTPLIISGKERNRSDYYQKVNRFIKNLKPSDYNLNLEHKQVFLKNSGVLKTQTFFAITNLFALENSELFHFLNNALYAHNFLKRNIDYIVQKNQILLVDQFTGRVLEGRNLSEGLHQALEAKEMVSIKKETNILASITYQNLFRLFRKISGMTGTAVPVSDELREVYNMQVVEVPPNLKIIRFDDQDKIYYNDRCKYNALLDEIEMRHQTGQPILIGTNALEISEEIAMLLKRMKLSFKLLNAKHHKKEARIIAHAGTYRAITIATNMAGRGTDIKLDEQAKQAGGLAVLGVARNESRRIDLQLRGRSGRQGEPGYSCYFISLDDVLFQRFGSHKLKKFFEPLKETKLQSRILSRTLKRAQKKLNNLNYDQRKNLLEYDNILAQQREIVYLKRENLIKQTDVQRYWQRLVKQLVKLKFNQLNDQNQEFNAENIEFFVNQFVKMKLIDAEIDLKIFTDVNDWNQVHEIFIQHFNNVIPKLKAKYHQFHFHIMKTLILKALDDLWSQYLDEISKIKASVFLYSYSQKQPLQIFIEKSESLFDQFKIDFVFNVFGEMQRFLPDMTDFQN